MADRAAGSSPAEGGNWRRQLILSLSDDAVQQRSIDRRLSVGVIVFAVFALFVGVVRDFAEAYMHDTDNLTVILLTGAVLIAFVVPVWLFANRFLVRMRSGTARERLLVDARRPILYLRSFGFEKGLSLGLSGNGPEELLVNRFAALGPVIGIGRPGEYLPPVGAARFYTSHETWQQKIAEVCAAAQYVVWVTGATDGLEWELSYILGHVPLDRVIVAAHPQWVARLPARREAEWGRFLSTLGRLFPQPLPQKLGDAWFFHFDKSGKVQGAEAGARNWLSLDPRLHGINTAADCLFVQMSLLKPGKLALRRWLLRLFGAVTAIGGLMLVLALAGAGGLILPACVSILIGIFGLLFSMRAASLEPPPERD